MSGRAIPKSGVNILPSVASLQAELERERRISSTLREVALAVGGSMDFDAILELVLAKCREIIDADRASLYLVDEHKPMLRSRILVGNQPQLIEVKVGEGIAGTVAKTGKPLRVRDAYKDRRFSRHWDRLFGYRTRTILAAPLKNSRGKVIGVVQALNKRGGEEFTDEDTHLLMTLTTPVAVIIENARLTLRMQQTNTELSEAREHLEARVRDLKLLFDLESAMGRAASIEALVSAALREAVRAADARIGAVLLPDEPHETSLLYLRAEPGRLGRLVVSPSEGFLGSVMRAGKPRSASRRSAVHASFEHVVGAAIETSIGVPLDDDAGVIGAIALYNKRGASRFQAEDRDLLRLIAANLSTAVQLHRSRAKQEQAERLSTIGRLLSSVIHDLKTPMSVISGYAQMMATEANPMLRAEYSEYVKKQFALIQRMQREVLEYARGEKTILVRRVYLAPYLKDLEQAIKPEAEAQGVKLSVVVDDRGTARFDETRVTRALHNLVRNALEAIGPKGGTLVVRVSRDADGISFSVSDDGPGIPKDIQRRLFESFVSGKRGGTGLGLANVKKVADEHGGRVSVETSHKGTTFHLLLPQERPNLEGASSTPAVVARPAGRRA